MKKTMMYLPDDMHRFLVKEAEQRGTSMAEIAREALAEYRSKRADATPKGVSAIVGVFGDDVDDPTMSASMDEVFGDYFAKGGRWEQENGLAERPD